MRYKVPKLSGVFCSLVCIETALFGRERCRWCGARMEKIYASLASRLCSPKCGEKYAAFVIGDATARLGTGKRFLEWLETNEPGAFRQLNGEMPKPLNAFRTGGRPKKYSNQTERKWARKGQGAQRQRSWRRRNAKPSRKSLRKKDV